MMKQVLLVLLFFASATMQVSVIDSLVPPLSLLPLHLLLGVIVLHRSGPEMGVAWFFASALVLPMLGFDTVPWFGYLLAGLTGAFLTIRLFTNRSVYALGGLVLTLFLITTASRWILDTSSVTSAELLTSMFLLVIATYAGFLLAKLTERILHQYFFVRESNAIS